MTRIGRAAALLALAGALILPASAAGGGPTASKSGAIINYVSGTKLKIGKRMQIVVVCSVDCNAVSKSTIKGPGVKLRGNVSGSLLAGVPGGPFFKPNGPLLKAMKRSPGRFRLINSITATDPATGATDAISRSFRLKR
jgi:hypothetical protein